MDKFLTKRSAESKSQESVEQVMKKFKTVCHQYSEVWRKVSQWKFVVPEMKRGCRTLF
jgi:hypothetical protein